MNDDEVEVARERTRAERDAEGWANAIVLSSDDDDDMPSALPAARPAPPAASNAAGKRPVSHPVDDVKPDVKRIKPDQDASAAPAGHVPAATFQRPAATATDLEDLSFAAPIKGAMGTALRAGHLMLKISTMALPDASSTHMTVGTGYERDTYTRLQALPWQAQVNDGTNGQELLAAIRRLANAMNTQVGRRAGFSLVECQWQPALPWRLKRGQPPVEVRLDVYLRPEIFDLRISGWQSSSSCFYDIWMLMDRLIPMAPYIECPRPPPVQGDAVLAPCGAATAPNRSALPPPRAHSFTLNGLMRAMESAGYEEATDPAGLQLTLFPFQRQSLQWMIDRETQPGGLNALFWREHPSEGSSKFFYNPMAGELRSEPPPIVTGGFLCEEMVRHRRGAKRLAVQLAARARAQPPPPPPPPPPPLLHAYPPLGQPRLLLLLSPPPCARTVCSHRVLAGPRQDG